MYVFFLCITLSFRFIYNYFCTGFSLNRYLDKLGYLVKDSLPHEVTEKLQTHLGLETFLLKPDCQNVTSTYSVAQHTVEHTGSIRNHPENLQKETQIVRFLLNICNV